MKFINEYLGQILVGFFAILVGTSILYMATNKIKNPNTCPYTLTGHNYFDTRPVCRYCGQHK